MASTNVLAKLAVQISANTAQFNAALSKTQRNLSSFTGGITKMAGALGIAFGVQQVSAFAIEVSRLSGEAQAVRAAFERLPQSTKLMMDLKAATGGTVSELDLMKRAVQASNFDISLAALPRLLEFATLRAQQTGQSVDYLVDSIVTGIGRKSKLILDNLGISAVALNEALGGTSTAMASVGDVADAVGKIAEQNLANMEKFSENASTKLQRLAGSWGNVKVAIGDAANGTGILGAAVDAVTVKMDLMASRNLTFWEKASALLGGIGATSNAFITDFVRKQEQANKESKKQEQIIREVDRAFKEFNGDIDAYGRTITTHIYRTELLAEFTKRLTQSEDDRVVTLGELRETEKELNDLATATNHLDTEKLRTIGLQIAAIKEKIKAAEALLKVEKEVALSLTAQRAIAGSGLNANGVTTAGGIGSMVAIDTERIAATAQAMVDFRNTSSQVTSEVQSEWLDLGNAISGALADIAVGLGRAATGAENFGDVILQSLGGFMQQFGAGLIALGIGKLSLEKFSGPGMIAAGFALAAAGAALQSSAQSEARNVGSSAGVGRVGASGFRANTSVQDTAPQLVTVLKGEDLWIVLQNYQANNRFTRG